MIVDRSMSPDWLPNTHLVAGEPGGDAFLVDASEPVEPAACQGQKSRCGGSCLP
jgi:hypothetical protein